MQLISEKQLQHIFKEAPAERIRRFLPLLNKTLEEFEINTPAGPIMIIKDEALGDNGYTKVWSHE